jgi:phage/plasmid-associated DNA primase
MCEQIEGRRRPKIVRGRRSNGNGTTNAVECELCAPLAIDEERFDHDPWIAGSPSGVIDIRSGMMRKHVRNDYLTKTLATDPFDECPMWLEFVEFVARGDAELVAYLQRLTGYER